MNTNDDNIFLQNSDAKEQLEDLMKHYRSMESRLARTWKALNQIGIHNMEDFEAARAKMKPLNIGCFTQQPGSQLNDAGYSEI